MDQICPILCVRLRDFLSFTTIAFVLTNSLIDLKFMNYSYFSCFLHIFLLELSSKIAALFSSPYRQVKKRGNIKTNMLVDSNESFLYCLRLIVKKLHNATCLIVHLYLKCFIKKIWKRLCFFPKWQSLMPKKIIVWFLSEPHTKVSHLFCFVASFCWRLFPGFSCEHVIWDELRSKDNHRHPNQLFKRSGLVPKTARNQEFHDNNFSYCSIFLLKIIATRINFKTEVKNFKTEIKNFKTETKNFITSFKLSSFCCKKITTLTLEVIILKLMGKRLMNTKTKKIILNQWLLSKPVRNQEFFVKQCVMIIAISIKLQ